MKRPDAAIQLPATRTVILAQGARTELDRPARSATTTKTPEAVPSAVTKVEECDFASSIPFQAPFQSPSPAARKATDVYGRFRSAATSAPRPSVSTAATHGSPA